MENQIEIKEAQHKADFLAAKELILEYVKWLGMDLSFQNFDKQMNSLPETYGNLDGRLFIAVRNDKAVGSLLGNPNNNGRTLASYVSGVSIGPNLSWANLCIADCCVPTISC